MAKPKLNPVLKNFLADLKSAEVLVSRVRALANIHLNGPDRSLHVKYVHRMIEFVFMGIISEWEDFLEQAFVRYLTGASTDAGFRQPLTVGRAKDIGNAYAIIAQDQKFDLSKHYLRFGDPKWTRDRANFFFVGGGSFIALDPLLARLKEANSIRNRIAHSSKKCKEDFAIVALAYINPSDEKQTQGFTPGELLSKPATRHFGPAAVSGDYLKAFFELFKTLSNKIIP